jgi:hypothetical protein
VTATLIICINLVGVDFPDVEVQRVIAAFSTFCVFIKVLDWLKLFQPTSFFIRLISETLTDIRYFSLIFLVALYMFGTPMYILNMNRGEDNAIVDEVLGSFWVFNVFYN